MVWLWLLGQSVRVIWRRAGIALMGVGVALLAADFIAEKATGRSLTDRSMFLCH